MQRKMAMRAHGAESITPHHVHPNWATRAGQRRLRKMTSSISSSFHLVVPLSSASFAALIKLALSQSQHHKGPTAMLATSAFSSWQTPLAHPFTPAKPSPLSPRRQSYETNARHPHLSMPSDPKQAFASSAQDEHNYVHSFGPHTTAHPVEGGNNVLARSPSTPFSQRKIKTDGGATLLGSRDALAERRRRMFARKVQEKRGDRRWEVRGEDVSWLFPLLRSRNSLFPCNSRIPSVYPLCGCLDSLRSDRVLT